MFIGNAMAVPPSKTFEYEAASGKIFDGKTMQIRVLGYECPKIFPMKEHHQNEDDEINGKYCGEITGQMFKASIRKLRKCHK